MDDGGQAVVRIKPLGAGGGGGEASAQNGRVAVRRDGSSVDVHHLGREKHYHYPKHVISPEHDQAALFDMFMPQRIDAFLSGVNVNVCCYGQTGSGKTHTMMGGGGEVRRTNRQCLEKVNLGIHTKSSEVLSFPP